MMGFCIVVAACASGCDIVLHTYHDSCPVTACLEAGHEARESEEGGNRLGRGNAYHVLSATSNSEARCTLHLATAQYHLCCNQETASVDERRC